MRRTDLPSFLFCAPVFLTDTGCITNSGSIVHNCRSLEMQRGLLRNSREAKQSKNSRSISTVSYPGSAQRDARFPTPTPCSPVHIPPSAVARLAIHPHPIVVRKVSKWIDSPHETCSGDPKQAGLFDFFLRFVYQFR